HGPPIKSTTYITPFKTLFAEKPVLGLFPEIVLLFGPYPFGQGRDSTQCLTNTPKSMEGSRISWLYP
ncbi:MAG: hypothetical protein KC643_26460, partial [Nitrospira sp.]|nr:hypothetical protein [Nitrospira sp.]